MQRLIIALGLTVTAWADDPAIFQAARSGNLQRLRQLLADTSQVSLRGERHRTPLHVAAEACQAESVRLLAEAGADRNVLDDQGRLSLALGEHCQDAGVRAAIRRYLKPPVGATEPNALQYAVSRGQAVIVSMLLTLSLDVNALDPNGDRALDIACLKGDSDIARILLNRGADPNLRNKTGATPLHDAALKGKRDIVELLLAQGALPNAPDSESAATPLHHAASFGRIKVVEVLLSHGANRELKDAKGSTALALASKNGHAEIAELLLRH